MVIGRIRRRIVGHLGATFKVYFGAGQANAAAFLTLQNSAVLRDVNIWYPNQNPNNITGYLFTITFGETAKNTKAHKDSLQIKVLCKFPFAK
jgi:hypothetical protein